MGTPRGPKPAKPYKDFPLFPHAAGVWAKKIKGNLHYFGPWSDPDGSLAKYRLQVDDLQAGRKPRLVSDNDLTVERLGQEFCAEKKMKMDDGLLSPHMLKDYQKVCALLKKHLGGSRRVDDLRPSDFKELRQAFRKGPRGPRSIVAITNLVRMTRVIFRYAAENELIDRPLNFGTAFKMPTKAELLIARQNKPLREFSAEEIKSLVKAASVPMRAMVLLAINCGMGNRDCSALTFQSMNLETGWLDSRRPKTGISRRAKLWKETVKAIRAAIAERPDPKSEADAELIFITQRGQAWVRARSRTVVSGADEILKLTFADSIIQEFVKLLAKVGIDRDNANFYGLRHSFFTVADEVRDKPAVDRVMGHASGGIDSHYRERIDDARLVAVAEYVHRWVFRDAAKKLRAK